MPVIGDENIHQLINLPFPTRQDILTLLKPAFLYNITSKPFTCSRRTYVSLMRLGTLEDQIKIRDLITPATFETTLAMCARSKSTDPKDVVLNALDIIIVILHCGYPLAPTIQGI
jgi:hypothetical protein